MSKKVISVWIWGCKRSLEIDDNYSIPDQIREAFLLSPYAPVKWQWQKKP
jgi:hypothetical protein